MVFWPQITSVVVAEAGVNRKRTRKARSSWTRRSKEKVRKLRSNNKKSE